MRVFSYLIPAIGLAALGACSAPATPLTGPEFQVKADKGAKVTGSYTANVGAAAPIVAEFDVSAKADGSGAAGGEFTFYAPTSTGTIDFTGRVTCLVVDQALKRAWIGAVITRNGSTRPTHDGSNVIHRVGHDIWFRVADRSPGGSGDPDRTTSVGFEGSGGIATSADYCALTIWPNDGVPRLSGNLTIH